MRINYTVEQRRALKGAGEVIHRNRIPGRLLRHLLTFVTKGTWFLDLCSGYQTNRAVVEEAGLIYIAVDIEEFFKTGPGRTAQASVVADLVEIDPEELLKRIKDECNQSPEDLAFIWFSPPCETNSSMNRTNEARDRPDRPVTWHRSSDGEPRPDAPGDLARKHDILILKWTQWITGQWGQTPDKSQDTNPVPSDEMPDAHIRFRPTHKPGTTEMAPYQPWPVEAPPATRTQNVPPAGRIPPQSRQGARGENSLGRKYLPSDENDDAVERAHPATQRADEPHGESTATAPEVEREWLTSPPSLSVRRLKTPNRRRTRRPQNISE